MRDDGISPLASLKNSRWCSGARTLARPIRKATAKPRPYRAVEVFGGKSVCPRAGGRNDRDEQHRKRKRKHGFEDAAWERLAGHAGNLEKIAPPPRPRRALATQVVFPWATALGCDSNVAETRRQSCR